MDKTYLGIIEITALCLIDVGVILGNILVILAFWLGPRRIRTYTNFFVVNLAVSDLAVGFVSLPLWTLNRADLISQKVYMFFITLDILCGSCSIMSLAAISLERMYAVKFPVKHFNLSTPPVMCVIGALWTYSTAVTAVQYVVTSLRTYTALLFVSVFLIPLVIIIVCYCIIFYTAVRMEEPSNQQGNIIRELQVAKTISVIISLFIVCWMPFFVINMVYIFCDNDCSKLPVRVIHLAKAVHYSNSMMNFLVYAVRSPDFRLSFKAILFKCDTASLREKIRTFSEVVVTRSRTGSERQSFLPTDLSELKNSADTKASRKAHDNNPKYHLQKSKTTVRNSRLSNNSTSTEVSIFVDDVDDQSNSPSSATSYLNKIGEDGVSEATEDLFDNENLTSAL